MISQFLFLRKPGHKGNTKYKTSHIHCTLGWSDQIRLGATTTDRSEML